MIWLSHHYDDELHRTVAIGNARVCARCLGLYPTLMVAIVAQLAWRSPLAYRYDAAVTLGLAAPALVDWAWGQLRPHASSNAIRLTTGMLLGVALGRSLYIHMQRPLPIWLLIQLAAALIVGLPVLFIRYRSKSAR